MNKLNFTIQPQEQTEWCWAAVTASIANFFAGNSNMKQCALVNNATLRSDCCDEGDSDPCNQPFALDTALRRLSLLQKTQRGQPGFKAVADEIAAGRPLAVRILWSEGGGHAIVVYGVTDDRRLHIADPENANDDILVPFDGFTYKDIGSWDDSLFTQRT